ncbi:MAG: hypothetical protein JRK53_01655 [Deltaproteobacteria bacterium]|nr:hypothetical protein [Deltaproteobacteria bacterium]MBW1817177.1 hypothetical protein [Deltaproteobacteria bacterium]
MGEFVVVVVVVIEEIMQFGHEQLDIYRVSPEYAAEKVGRRTAITTTTTSTTTNALILATFAFFARETQPPCNPQSNEVSYELILNCMFHAI